MLCREIYNLQIEGGILDGCRADFRPGLNCIIGARGTGKSTLLKLLRFSVGSLPAAKPDRERFLRDIAAILGSGRTSLEFSNEFGQRRKIVRSPGRFPRLYDESGQLLQEGCELGIRLEAFAQGELEGLLLKEQGTALAFFDSMIEGIEDLKQSLQENRVHRQQIQARYESARIVMEEQRNRLERKRMLMNELRALDLGEPEQRQAAMIQERGLVEAIEKQWRQRLQILSSFAWSSCCQGDEASYLNFEILDEMTVLSDQYREQVQQLLGQAAILAGEGLERWTEVRARLEARHEEQEDELRESLRQHGFQAAEQLQEEKKRLLQELAALQGCEEEGREAVRLCQRLREHKSLLVIEAREIEDAIAAKRYRLAEQLNLNLAANPLIQYQRRIHREEYIEFLTTRLKGSVKRGLLERIATMVRPEQLWQLAEDHSYEALADLVHCWQEEAMQVLLLLGAGGDAGRLTEIELSDELKIYYQPPNGMEPMEAGRLSPGLQCSLLLPILLMARSQVLIGDQFEDNLDNACIHQMIISRILKIGDRRQIILATHNPNIVVGGAAGQVIVMKAAGLRCRVEAQGGLYEDRVREEIITTLEGGREAFGQRVAYLGVG
ncbi:MAG: hypothetical protein ACM3PE_03525 [Deltaproteobacteria bacterium]